MYNMVFFYLIFPVLILVFLFLSREETLPEGIEEKGISRAYLKMSLYIYRLIRKKLRSFRTENIRMYLGALNRQKNPDNAETEYFIRKISIVLVMATAGSLLSILMCISSANSSHIEEDARIKRNEFGDREYEVSLVARNPEGEEVFEESFPVKTRQYTDREAAELFEKASSVLEGIILGENDSLDEVTKDLNLVESIEGFPFQVSWKMDNYDVIHFDGKLQEENIPETGVLVKLTATYRYMDMTWQQEFYANIKQRSLSGAEKAFREVKELLNKADEDSLTGTMIDLPNKYQGEDLCWEEKKTDNSMLLLLLTLIGAAASFVLKDKELKKAVDDRNNQMLMDYPQFVSQLVLYLGAGMTVRNVFAKLSDEYIRSRKEGAERRYLYEELLRTVRELSIGRSESASYEEFGIRCGGGQYTRLASLLSQNLRKGNGELLRLLQEESKKAFEERMDKARKLGEEAGTKLLLPMIIMLVIVMIIIMIPAYMAF